MAPSVRPQTIQDDLADLRSRQAKPRSIAQDLARIRGDTGDIDLRTPADDVSTKQSAPPPYLTGEFAGIHPTPLKLLVRPPADVRTGPAPIPAAADAARVKADLSGTGHLPGQGESLPNAVAESAMETITHPVRTAVEIAETPGKAGYAVGKYARGEGSGKEAAIGALQTAVMLGAGPAERLIEPVAARALGETAGPIVTRAALGAGGGAAFSPDRPAVGATLGAAIGGASGAKVPDETAPEGKKRLISPTQKAVAEHVTEERQSPEAPPALFIERRSTPSTNRPVWTPEERAAYHVEQTGRYNRAERLSRPESPAEVDQTFERGRTEPFPYQTASELADNAVGDLEYRHSGVGIIPETAKRVRAVVGSALYSPAAAIRESHPELTAAGEAAISAPANARHIGQVQTKWVTDGVDPKAADAFLPQLQLDRLNHLMARDPSLVQDPAFAKNLFDLQSRVPQGFHETPEFRQMAERYKNLILSQTEPAAASAGLKPEQFAQLPNGYVRLVASETAPEGTYADFVGGSGPKKLPTTRLTTAQKASGTGAYTNSLAETVTADALDKIVKARHNEFYQRLLKEGTVLEDPRASVPEGQAKIMFNDQRGIITDPAQAKVTLAVPNDVAMYAKHVFKTLNETGPTTPAGVAARGASRAAGGLALLANPAAATSHSLTLANTVGTVPEVGKPLNNLVGVVPGGTTAKGAFDIATIDRTTPETRALEQRLSRIGALRPEMTHPEKGFGKVLEDMRGKLGPFGKVLSPHEILFGEDGIDKRSRIALADKYIQAADARGIPVTDAALREFVVQHAGDYIKGNAGALVNHLQDSNMALFARMGVTRVTNAAKSAVGKSGLPEATKLQKASDIASTLTRGIVGYGVGLTALNYVLSGHSPLSNEPGHMADLEYKTDEQGKKHYIRGAVLNPLVSTAVRMGAESAVRGDPAGVARDVTNTALGVGTSHPLVRGAVEATTGRQPYVERDGTFLRTVPPELASGDQVTGRLKAAARDMTAAGQFLGATSEKNPGLPGGKALSYLTPPITATASPGGESRVKAQSARDWLDDRTMQVYRAAGDTTKQQKIIDQAIEDAKKFNESNEDDQVTIGMVQRDLRRAAAKANSGIRRPNRLVRPTAR